MYFKCDIHTECQRLKYEKSNIKNLIDNFLLTPHQNGIRFGKFGWIKYISIVFTCIFVLKKKKHSYWKIKNYGCSSHCIPIGQSSSDLSKIGYSTNEMVGDPWEKVLWVAHHLWGNSMIRFAWGSLSSCGIFINSVPANSQRCPCMDDKLCGTLHIAL